MRDIYYAARTETEQENIYFWNDYNDGILYDGLVIMPQRWSRLKYTNELFDRITGSAEEAAEAAEDFEYMGEFYKNFTEYLNDTFKPVKPYNTRQIHRIKELLPLICEKSDPEAIARLMTMTSGKEWRTRTLTGYCQGDYAEAIFLQERWTREAIEKLETEFWGGGETYNVYVNGEYEVTVYIPEWDNEKIKKEIADCVGCDPEEIIFDEAEAEEALREREEAEAEEEFNRYVAALEWEAGTPA